MASGNLAKNVRSKFVSRAALPSVNMGRLEREFFPLVKSGRLNKYDVVKLIENGFDLNRLDEGGDPALFHAVLQGRREMIDLLLANGADPNVVNAEGENIFFLVGPKLHGLYEIAYRNTDRYENNNDYYSNEENYKRARQQVLNAYEKADKDFQAMKKETLDFFLSLKEKGADINLKNREGDTPLIDAIKKEDEDGIQGLLELGADTQEKDADGNTPLLRLLIQYEASPSYSLIQSIQALLKAGADLRSKGANGRTGINIVKSIPELQEAIGSRLPNLAWNKRGPLVMMRRRRREAQGYYNKNNNTDEAASAAPASAAATAGPRNAWNGGKRKTRRGRKGRGKTRKN